MPATLLLADDSVTIQRVIELTFANEDVRVVAVSDGESAVQRIDAEPPDIVLADVGMPKLDGYAVASHIKQSPALKHIPVLLLTGAFEPVDEARARESGCDGILVKPFEPQQLVARVKELLAEKRSAGPSPAAARNAGTPRLLSMPPGIEPAFDVELDQLDAAFVSDFGGPRDKLGRPDPRDLIQTFGDWDVPPRATPIPPEAVSEDAIILDEVTPSEPAFSEHLEAAPPAAVEPAAAVEPVAAAPAPAQGPRRGAGTASIAGAFSALLAAEQGKPVVSPFTAAAPVISEPMVEELVRRVLSRMTDEAVRRVVVDTAERVIREEIERIKTTPR